VLYPAQRTLLRKEPLPGRHCDELLFRCLSVIFGVSILKNDRTRFRHSGLFPNRCPLYLFPPQTTNTFFCFAFNFWSTFIFHLVSFPFAFLCSPCPVIGASRNFRRFLFSFVLLKPIPWGSLAGKEPKCFGWKLLLIPLYFATGRIPCADSN